MLGYYLSDDDAVIRKHTQMLVDAGVDVLIFDVTNGWTYEDVYLKLCALWAEMRREGLRTPRLAFIAHSGEGQVVQRLYDNFYRQGLHSDLWFRWQGKPLVLAAPAALTLALREFFTVRESWAWTKGHPWFADGRDKWPWLDNYPQNFGWHDDPQKPEHISVTRTREPLSPATNANWMLLFIDADRNATNGWLGYDFVVNRSAVRELFTALERYQGPGCRWSSPKAVSDRAAGNELEVAIAREAMGWTIACRSTSTSNGRTISRRPALGATSRSMALRNTGRGRGVSCS